ncbi:glycosyl hydrolase family 18 protein [Paenibacillus sp. TAB 01]|uniref:glycosyl hydrolase family 18 protein n=1 Tax=Paenibacillus sp. TAB 01 TaxID=3368988 RepID=UPI0037523E69
MYKKAISITLLALSLFQTASAQAYTSRLTPFADVDEKAWSAENIYMLSSVNALDGYEDGTFRPLDAMTREAFLRLFVSAVNAKPEAQAIPIKDVAPGRWSYEPIQAALQRHWINFMLDDAGEFRPAEPIQRQEAAAVMGHMLLDKLSQPEREQWLNSGWLVERDKLAFADTSGIAESLAPYVFYTVQQGIMQGNETGFSPVQPLNRQEAAKVIRLALDMTLRAKPLEITGFYAIQSYASLNRVPLLDQVAMGWSHLSYSGAGAAEASLAKDSSKFSIPDGWEEVTAAADQAAAAKELVVFANESHHVTQFLADAAARKAFVASLLRLLDDPKYGFQGVCLDFEDLYQESSREDFNAFVGEIKDALKGNKLTVALPPLFYYAGYDAKFIGGKADTVILMAYNFLHKDSRLPSAPLPLVSEAVRQMLDAGVSADKLVLGIGKQANQWIDRPGEAAVYESPASDLVEQRLKQPGVAQSLAYPYLLNRITYEDNGQHELYYEDADSIERKMWVARYYGLKGVSLWYMGQFTDQDWERIAAENRDISK